MFIWIVFYGRTGIKSERVEVEEVRLSITWSAVQLTRSNLIPAKFCFTSSNGNVCIHSCSDSRDLSGLFSLCWTTRCLMIEVKVRKEVVRVWPAGSPPGPPSPPIDGIIWAWLPCRASLEPPWSSRYPPPPRPERPDRCLGCLALTGGGFCCQLLAWLTAALKSTSWCWVLFNFFPLDFPFGYDESITEITINLFGNC